MQTALAGEYIFQEIYEQPAIVRRHLGSSAPPWPAPGGQTIITGSGDSHAAAELLGHLFPHLRVAALSAMHASQTADTLRAGDALLGISVSGRTVRVIEAALRARAAGATVVAVTDDPHSPLAAQADATWLIGASPADALQTSSYTTEAAQGYVGYHHDVAQTKTCLAAIVAVARAAAAASSTGPAETPAPAWDLLPAQLENLVQPSFHEPLLPRASALAEAGQAFFLGTDPTLPLARFGCYKMFEYNRIAHFTDIEEYCHTHYFITRPGDAVIFVVHDAASAERAAEIGPVLTELFDARIVVVHPADTACPAPLSAAAVAVPTGRSQLERLLGLLVAIEWVTYLWGRIGAPDINTFHAGYDTERLVGASGRTIRASRIRPPHEA